MNKEERIAQYNSEVAALQNRIKKIEEIMIVEEELGLTTGYLAQKLEEAKADIAAAGEALHKDLQEGEDRPLFIRYLQEGNAEGCAKMVEDCILDNLADLGAEQSLARVLAKIVHNAVRIGIIKFKLGLQPTESGKEGD